MLMHLFLRLSADGATHSSSQVHIDMI